MSLLSELLWADGAELSADELNRRARATADALEELRAFAPDWEAQVNALKNVGLQRINDALLPAYDAILGLAQLGALFTAQSPSEVTVGTGERVFAVAEDKRIVFAPAANLAVRLDADPTIAMYGRLVGYDRDSGVLAVDIDQASGGGTHAGWTISASPPRSVMHELRDDNPHGVTAGQVGTLTAAEILAALNGLADEIGIDLALRVAVEPQAFDAGQKRFARANIGAVGNLLGPPKLFINTGGYTAGPEVSAILVEVQGAGGGGGGGRPTGGTSQGMGGGGGAGGYVLKFFRLSDLVDRDFSFAIGAPGLGQISTGATGGTTTFMHPGNSITLSAVGGNGGDVYVGAGAAAVVSGAGAAGGTASGGDYNRVGQSGEIGAKLSASSRWGGKGGDSKFGAGGRRQATNTSSYAQIGNNAFGFGAGGGGAISDVTVDVAGGNGTSGLVAIWEFG